MLRLILTTGLTVLLLVALAPGAVTGQEVAPEDTEVAQEDTEEAQEVAEEWLALTDAGEFGESWEEAGALLQESVTKEDWVSQGEMLHEQLEPVTSREFGEAQYAEDIPDAPEGEYTFVQYITMFGQLPVMEVVVLNMEGNDWKVVGYQVEPAQQAPEGMQ